MKKSWFHVLTALVVLGSLFRVEALERNVASVLLLKSIDGYSSSVLWDRYLGLVKYVLSSVADGKASDTTRRAQLALGCVFDRVGDSRSAIEQWRLANAAPFWEHLGDLAINRDPLASIAYRKRAIDIAPSRLENYFTLANIYWPELGRAEDAIKIYSRASAVAPAGSFERHLADGWAFRLQEQWDHALESFEEAVQVNPTSSDAHQLAVFVARKLNAFDTATNHLHAALKLVPKDGWVASWLNVELGDLSREKGQTSEASYWYSEAGRMQPNNPGAHRGHAALGEHYFGLRNFSAAAVEFRAASVLSPKDWHYYSLLAASYEGVGQKQDAANAYRKILELDSNNAEAQRALAQMLKE